MAALPPIHGSSPIAKPAQGAASKDVKIGGDNAFEKLLARTNDAQQQSDKAITDLVTGKSDDVQQVVMQVVKSEMSFQLFMEVRNQLIESYNELMRMQF